MRNPKPLVAFAVLCLATFLAPPASGHVEIERQVAEVSRRIAQTPGDVSLYIRRGELYRAHGDFDLAMADFQVARSLDPDLPAVDLCVGSTHLDAGRPAEALVSLDRFLARLPRHVGATVLRARALAALGERLAAAVEYTEAIRLATAEDPPRPESIIERAQVLSAEGPEWIPEAIAGLDEGITRLGPLPVLQLLAAELELGRGSPDAALDRLESAWASSARKETFLERKGEILERSGRMGDACRAYEEALEAWDALPASRKAARAMTSLEGLILAGLDRTR
jgi:tetratricopeptide (TPR) repeat protein